MEGRPAAVPAWVVLSSLALLEAYPAGVADKDDEKKDRGDAGATHEFHQDTGTPAFPQSPRRHDWASNVVSQSPTNLQFAALA